MKYLTKTEVPVGESGAHKIERFTVKKSDSDWVNLSLAMSGLGHRRIEPGRYTRLVREGQYDPIMSDTPAEFADHWQPVDKAHDDCLIAGLGLGIVAEACLRKDEVTSVTIIEKSPDVIALVAPYLQDKWGKRITIIEADIFEWRPPVGTHYAMAWFDIWDDMCADNLPQMAKLSRRFTRCCDWYGHWGRDEIRRNERRYA